MAHALPSHAGFRGAAIGGVVLGAVMAAVAIVVGQVGGGEARTLLEATLPTTRFFCSAVMTAAATTLALMLTLLGLSTDAEADIRGDYYHRIQRIALLDVVAFAGATVFLLAHAIPFGETIEVPAGWYVGIYYVFIGLSAFLGGLMVAVMMMLYSAVGGLIALFWSDGDSPLVADSESAGEDGDAATAG
ncbi:MAG: hypothetical protein R3181_08190 [Rubricoccaceae bacterium]|nr:hypothetical protein [Rubricoccaceae bacterium]